MHAWWGLLSADVHWGDRRRSSLLQLPASMGNCYYISFVKYVSRIPLQLTGHTYCSLSSLKKTMGSLGGLILDQFIRISSTSTTYRIKSSIYKGKLAAGTRKTKTTTTTMVQVHRRHSTMIHIAPALIIRTRGLRRHPRHHHQQQWEDTVEKVQHNLLCGHTTRRNLSYSHVTSMCLLFGLIT